MGYLYAIILMGCVLVCGSDGPYFPWPNLIAALVALGAGISLWMEERR